MSKEILTVVEVVSNEKGVSKEIIFEALEAALATATKKRYPDDIDVHVVIDRVSGDYRAFRRWEILPDEAPPPEELPEGERPGIWPLYEDRQILLAEARNIRGDAEVGEYIEEELQAADFGRIAAQTAKQVIVQKVREAERAQVVDAYRPRIGSLIAGTVKRVDRTGVIVDLGSNVEALVPREEMIPREAIRVNDRYKAYLKDVRPEKRGPQVFLSRTAVELLVELFKLEVPEISDGVIEILGAARDPGQRAKIAVRSRDQRVDPVGACVGMRGSRVQAVSNELSGERVDIVLWNENPAQYVINAMSPAEVVSILVDEDAHSVDVAVVEEQLSLAIGRGGQNVKLASQLTGWRLNVMSESAAQEKDEREAQRLQRMFMDQLDVDEEIANILVQEGFSSVEEVAYVPEKEMLEIQEFDEDLVAELRGRAKDVLLVSAIAEEEERLAAPQPAEDLLAMEGMDEELAFALARLGVCTMEDLAEQAVDDLLDIDGLTAERAGALIMTARRPWFQESAGA
jgi:transcription termination/antitermination protein NusA